MKRMIISPAQLRAINEASVAPSVVYANDATTPGVTAAVKSSNNTGNTFSVKTPGTGGTVSATLPELENGIDLKNASKVEVTKDPSKQETSIMESRFSKRQVELGRMLEMRRTGKVFSKKQLNEMFMETQENADELRRIFQNGGGRNLAFKVAEIIDDVFPEESYGSELLDAVLGGADPAEFIIQNIFSDFADKEEEREVLDRIRELTTKRGF